MTYSVAANSPLLTDADELALAREIEAGVAAKSRIDKGRGRRDDEAAVARGIRARRRFIEANMRLVVSIASKMSIPGHIDRQDAIQDGMIGLDRAVTKFDRHKGYRFSTYATWWIRKAIQQGLETTASTVRIPADRSSELRSALAALDGDLTALPDRLTSLVALTNLESIDRPIGDGTTIADLTPGDLGDPESIVETLEERRAVIQLIAQLDQATADAERLLSAVAPQPSVHAAQAA